MPEDRIITQELIDSVMEAHRGDNLDLVKELRKIYEENRGWTAITLGVLLDYYKKFTSQEEKAISLLLIFLTGFVLGTMPKECIDEAKKILAGSWTKSGDGKAKA